MKNVRSCTLARLGTTLVVMMLLGGCLTPSGEPVLTADSPEPDIGNSGTGNSGTGNSAPTIQGNPAAGITVGQVYLLYTGIFEQNPVRPVADGLYGLAIQA